MSERDLKRIEVLSEVLGGRWSVAEAAKMMKVTERHAYRLLMKYQDEGGTALAHKARGRKSNHSINPGIRKYAVELVQTQYADFGPTFAAEVLADKHGIRVGRETLRRWLMAEGLWLSRKQRKTFHQPRLRRESYGELIQIDGSEHRWFEDRGEPCTLLVFIDDATSKLMQLRFVLSESTETYFEALRGYLIEHGRPIAFYSDKHTVFRVNRDAKGGPGVTQFGRALAELNIDIMCANSSQAKGRVERANRTLQDRLVKELRMANVSDINSGNTFLPSFIERFNQRFAIPPAKPQDLHRPLQSTTKGLTDILCHRELRYIGEQLTFHYKRKQMILDRTDIAAGLIGEYVEIYEFADKPIEVRWQGHVLTYRVFDKDQRVSITAVVENKRLGHALAIVKEKQNFKPAARILTNSEKDGYVKRPRRTYGPDFAEKVVNALEN